MTRNYRGKPDLEPGPARDLVALFSRLRAGSTLSLGQIAVKSRLATSHVSEVLRGWKAPSPQAAAAIATALGGDAATALRARRLAEDLAELNRYRRAQDAARRTPAADDPAAEPHGLAGRVAGAATGPARKAAAVSLRRKLPDFHGREKEIARVAAMLGDRGEAPAVVVLYGMGGVGKTTIANEIGHRLGTEFTAGRVFVDLGTVDSGAPDPPTARQAGHPPREVPASMAATRMEAAFRQVFYAFGVPEAEIPPHTDQQAQFLQQLLARGPCLLILDNAERAAQVAPMLPVAPGSAAIITSRSPLLALDGARRVNVLPLPLRAGVELFGKLADREEQAGEDDAARRIAELTDGLPLAIRIAAALASGPALRDAPLGSLVSLLEAEEQRLAGFEDGERGVRASFAISYRALPPDVTAYFHVLGLLPTHEADIDLTAAAAGIPVGEAEELARSLVHTQLVDTVGPQRRRLRMHDLVRLYARQTALAAHDADFRSLVLGRVLDWYAMAADRLQDPPSGPHHPSDAALAWFEREHVNAIAVAYAAFEADDWPRLGRLSVGLRALLWYVKRWEDLAVTEEWAVEAAGRAGNWRGEVDALMYLAESRRLSGRPREVAHLYERALSICRREGDVRATAWVTTHLGDSFADLDDPERAIAHYEEALALFRSIGLPDQELWLAAHFNDAYLRAGRVADAIRAGEQWLAMARRLNDEGNEIWVWWHLAHAYREVGRFDEALEALHASVAFHRGRGDLNAVVQMLTLLAETQRAAGLAAEAEATLREALRLARGVGIKRFENQIIADLRQIRGSLD